MKWLSCAHRMQLDTEDRFVPKEIIFHCHIHLILIHLEDMLILYLIHTVHRPLSHICTLYIPWIRNKYAFLPDHWLMGARAIRDTHWRSGPTFLPNRQLKSPMKLRQFHELSIIQPNHMITCALYNAAICSLGRTLELDKVAYSECIPYRRTIKSNWRSWERERGRGRGMHGSRVMRCVARVGARATIIIINNQQ